MLTNKYAKEYRLDTEKDAKGKIHEKSIYTGPLFFLKTDESQKKKICVHMIFCTLAALVLFVSGLWNQSVYMHVFYISIPSICQGIMIYLLGTGCLYLWGGREFYTREQRDKSGERIKLGGAIGMILGGGTLLGIAIYSALYRPGVGIWDVYYIITIALQTLIAGYAFWNGKKIWFEQVENPDSR